jgi:hypothetical protein
VALLSLWNDLILRRLGETKMGQVIEIARRKKQIRKNKLRSVPPGRRTYAVLRSREYLLPEEVETLTVRFSFSEEWWQPASFRSQPAR